MGSDIYFPLTPKYAIIGYRLDRNAILKNTTDLESKGFALQQALSQHRLNRKLNSIQTLDFNKIIFNKAYRFIYADNKSVLEKVLK